MVFNAPELRSLLYFYSHQYFVFFKIKNDRQAKFPNEFGYNQMVYTGNVAGLNLAINKNFEYIGVNGI